jgi:hypothetical protein
LAFEDTEEAIMHTAIAAGVLLVLVAAPIVVSAQPTQVDPRLEPPATTTAPSGHMGMHQGGMHQGAMSRHLSERLSSLKAALRLTPEQERHWAAYESALQSLSSVHRERMAVMQDQSTTDPTQRLRQRADVLSKMSAALTRVAEAQEPLYNSLEEAQKRRFAEFSPASFVGMRRHHEDDDRRASRDDDMDRRRRWRDRDDERRDRDYDRSWRDDRYGDGDRGWRDRHHHRHGWRERDDDRGWRGRDDDRDRPYGRYDDDDRECRERAHRHHGWREEDYERRHRDHHRRDRD